MVDMICVKDFATRIPVLEELGVDVIAVHTGADQQQAGRTPIEDLIEMKKNMLKKSTDCSSRWH